MSIPSTNRGFTLIELLVVVAIIAILASVVVISLDQAKVRAQDSQRVSELKELQRALETYYSFNASYPQCTAADGWCETDSGEFQSALQPLVDANLIQEIVSDPLNRDGFIYEYYTQDGSSDATCGDVDVDEFRYVIRFATAQLALPWLESSNDSTDGNEYCLTAQSQ